VKKSLVHAVARAVAQDPLLPLLRFAARAAGGVDDDDLPSDTARFREYRGSLRAQEVAVEVAHDDPVEPTVRER